MTTVSVRPAVQADAAALLTWRNDPRTVAASLNPVTVSSDEHARWFAGVLRDPFRVLLIGEVDAIAIGMCRFDLEQHSAEVSINLDPTQRGRGHGRQLLAAALGEVGASHPELDVIVASVKADNDASLALFAGAGFVVAGTSGDVLRLELGSGEPGVS